MARGGARATSGPPPDPNALRRDRPSDAAGWETLPAEGRKGRAPKWPLSPPTTSVDGAEVLLEDRRQRELKLWRAEWRRPQAVVWERNGQELEVALYVRALVTAEQPDAPTNSRALVRQAQEALGISLPGLHRNRWRIGETAAASSAGEVRASSRGRFTVVPGGNDPAA